ncbi:MAG: quinoprotein dehydrogenase-associated putative ABC transporter substrate-binding protein [Methyloceanibacter sp.]|nr:quinoprotein dehydrogenase-associated putative ABC transporter substrate-binding protein [Methyloceanibacter sp.]
MAGTPGGINSPPIGPPYQLRRTPVPFRISRFSATFAIAAIAVSIISAHATAKELVRRDLNKNYEELTPGEHIAIRAAAKAAYKAKKLNSLSICADPGNMPLSNMQREGFQNKLAEILADATGAKIKYHWQPLIERGFTRSVFDDQLCDVMFDIPTSFDRLLTTEPIYKTPYVLVYRNDKGLKLSGLDDPKLKDLTIGVFQTSGVRQAMAKRDLVSNVKLQVQTHDGDLVPENQPWYVVQRMLDGEFDVASVYGPFAGWVKTMKNEPVDIVPINLDDDMVPMEFEMSLGVRKTDAFLKYLLEWAMDDKAEEIAALLKEYGVPMVECSKCYVQGDLPAHGSYIALADQKFEARPDLASADQVVTREKLEAWLEDGADPDEELHNALLSGDGDRIKFLVSKGADVNKSNLQGWTPLTAAARQRRNQTIDLLIELGADPNKPDGNGQTPLTAALMRDHVPSIETLVKQGADTEVPGAQDFRPLALALADKKYEAAKALMNGGADVSIASGAQNLTPLMVVAAQIGPAEGAMFVPGSVRPTDIAKALIESGADIDAQAENGMTALMIAAANNSAPMIGLLMAAGANPDVKNAQGQTAIDVANFNDNKEASQAIRVLALTGTTARKKPGGNDNKTVKQ